MRSLEFLITARADSRSSAKRRVVRNGGLLGRNPPLLGRNPPPIELRSIPVWWFLELGALREEKRSISALYPDKYARAREGENRINKRARPARPTRTACFRRIA